MRAVRLIILLVLGGLIYRGGAAALESAPFELKILEVEGNSGRHVTDDQIVEAAQLRKGSKLFEISSSRVSQRITESIPWIAEVRVERLLPSRLRIEVLERRPELLVVTAAGPFLVDRTGLVLQRGSESLVEVRDLPVGDLREGQTVVSPEFDNAAAIYRALPERVRKSVSAISAPTIDQTTVRTMAGPSIFYGAAEQLEEKNFAIESLLARSQPGSVIDVRVPSRPTVRIGQ